MGGGVGALDAARALASIVAGHIALAQCDCILMSGGIDTSFIALADHLNHGLLETAVTVAGEDAPDLPHAIRVASELGLRHIVVDPGRPAEGFWRAVEQAILELETVDPVEVASAAVLLKGLAAAKAAGCKCVATGDGGDELFLGYGFLHGLPHGHLEEWRRRMQAGRARFTAPRIGAALGVRVALPLYSPEARLLASRLSTEDLVGPSPPGAPLGKAPLRMYLYLNGLEYVAYRPKEPVTRGSRALGLLEEVARGRPRARARWPPTWLHAVLQRVQEEAGTGLPRPCPDARLRCPVCGACMRDGHCPYCGAYVAGGRVSVYKPGVPG